MEKGACKEFEYLALPYLDVIYRVALRMTRNKTEAEDLTQDTYLRAFWFFDKFQRGTSIKAWLFKILKNVYLNKQIRNSQMSPMVDIAEVEGILVAPETPEEEVFGNLLDEEIQEALNNLPEEFRFAVILYDLEGFTYKEVAEILGCALGTVMSRLHRGRRLLRKSLAGYAQERGYGSKEPVKIPA